MPKEPSPTPSENQDADEPPLPLLIEGEQELRAAMEFRERLLGIVAHDLRTPLGAISMCAQTLLLLDHLDAESKSLVAIQLRSVQRMERMIRHIFEFTRPRLGGAIPIEPRPADLRPLCQQAIEELAFLTKVSIRQEFAGDTTGNWDADRLTEALSNLIANAVEHATPGTTVLVKAYGDKDAAVLEVQNHGYPIPPEQLAALFGALRRDGRDAEKTGHFGLGLFIADEIVRAHGGTIAAHCTDGTTTFTVRLPRSS